MLQPVFPDEYVDEEVWNAMKMQKHEHVPTSPSRNACWRRGKCGRSGQTSRDVCASLGWRKHAEGVLVEMAKLVPHDSDIRQYSLVDRKE